MKYEALIIPDIFKNFPQVRAAQSTRYGGLVSAFGSFNLGEAVGDDLSIVQANKVIFCKYLGFGIDQLAKSKQVHGLEILYATEGGRYEGYDAIYTDKVGILVAVTIADCVPILLFDSINQVVAAVHAGWKGSSGLLLTKVINKFISQFNSSPKDIYAYIGTCISGISYEVDWDVAQYFDEKYRPYSYERQKYMLDLPLHNYDQLVTAGINPHQIQRSDKCTLRSKDKFYSHRGDKGKSGRMLAAIGMI